jgi:hypothetical protein
MKLSAANKKILVNEIKFSIEKMKETEDPKTRLYFFSAIYGIISRIFNLEFSSDLVIAHIILNTVHESINLRLVNPDKVIQIPKEVLDALITASEELKDVIEKNKNMYEVLKKFSLLAFVTSGNGYYLYQKKLLTF